MVRPSTNGETPQYGSVIAESAVYALRASILLASAQRPLPASRIASQLDMPRQYLEKVLGIMARAGSVTSQRGARGGFMLATPAEQTTLATIIAPFDSAGEKPRCLLEARLCQGEQGRMCAAHPFWHPAAQRIHEFFSETTVADLARGARMAGLPESAWVALASVG